MVSKNCKWNFYLAANSIKVGFMEIQLHLHVSIVPTETLFTAVFVYVQNLKHRQTILQNRWTNTLTPKLQKPFCPHHMHLRLSKRCKIRKNSDKTQALRSRLRTNMAPRSSWIQAPSKREQPEAIRDCPFWLFLVNCQYRDNYTIVVNNMLFVTACKFNS